MTFPKERWSEIDRIFDAALDEPQEERERFVRKASAGDSELEQEVWKLLALAESKEGDGLEASPEMKGILFEEVALALDSGYRELGAGDRLGPYEVVELLGRGGMGAVYRAKDPALERDVAIKALTRDFSADMTSLRRFEREAKVLASLNHPNIAAIFDLLKIDGRRYLVLELVEGETLQERLERGPIPVPELIRIALQMASALEEAHRKGVVHRDLKPSNVKLGREGDGRVKILDFGLAKPYEEEPVAPEQRPTTRTGAVLGTPGYMSPEQARGQTVDKRSDIWAFGCLLYEMTTGQRAFAGATVSDAIAAVLRDEADLGRLPRGTPPELVRLIERCLRQEPRERLQDIGDARIELSELESRGTSRRRSEVEQVWRSSGTFLALAVLLAFLAGMSFLRLLGGSGDGASEPSLVRASLNLGPEVRLWQGASSSFTLSPDGARVAFVGQHEGRIHLYLRELDSYEVSLLRNSEGARDPFFSPDGSYVGFFAEGELRKVSLARGVAERLTSASVQSRGASWNEGDTIVFAEDASPGLFTIDAQGGERRLIAEPTGASATEYLWPQWLGGSEAILFTVRASEGSGITDHLAVLRTATGEIETLVEGSQGFYASTGHLVYRREGALEAVPFDAEALSVEGPSVRVIEAIQGYPRGASAFSLSRSGTLLYMAPTVVTTLDRVSASDASAIVTPSGTPGWPRVSPDGRFAALHVGGPETRDVWILDLERPGSMRQLTYRGGGFPVWSADGAEIVFMSRRDGNGDLFKVAADGSGRPEPLLKTPRTKIPVSWSSRGVLAYYEIEESTQRDIWLLDPMVGEEPVAFVATSANELSPVFSPDGRFLAYVSNESGQNEVYVRPYPPPSPVTAVSIDGGTEPVWSRDGRFLYYRHRDSIMAVPVRDRARFEVGQPREVLATSMVSAAGGNPSYDVTTDSEPERFLVLRPVRGTSTDNLDLVLQWFTELETLAPRKR